MVIGLVSSMSAMIWGFGVIVILLLLWSILFVEFLYPSSYFLFHSSQREGAEWCEIAFSSVGNCLLFLFEVLVIGDSWGTCAFPLVMHNWSFFIIFALSFASTQLGVMNLVLAIVVHRANVLHEDEQKKEAVEENNMKKAAIRYIYDLFHELDTNGDEVISLDELMSGWDNNINLQNMFQTLHVKRCDIANIFALMDTDGSGCVSYDEMLQHFNNTTDHEVEHMIMLQGIQIKSIVQEVKKINNSRLLDRSRENTNDFSVDVLLRGPNRPVGEIQPVWEDSKKDVRNPTPQQRLPEAMAEQAFGDLQKDMGNICQWLDEIGSPAHNSECLSNSAQRCHQDDDDDDDDDDVPRLLCSCEWENCAKNTIVGTKASRDPRRYCRRDAAWL